MIMTHMTYVGDGDGGNGQKILVMANMMVMVMAHAELGFLVQMVEQRGRRNFQARCFHPHHGERTTKLWLNWKKLKQRLMRNTRKDV